MLLYDFSLEVGDSIEATSIPEPIQAHIGAYFYVSNIDTVEIGGKLRKRFGFALSLYENDPIYFYVVEGIGNMDGVLCPTYYYYLAFSFGASIRCYEYNGELVYHREDATSCTGLLSSINDIAYDMNSPTLYPNPTKEEVNITSNDIIKEIHIYNLLGEEVYSKAINDKTAKIDVRNFTNEIYTARIITSNTTIAKKFVKE